MGKIMELIALLVIMIILGGAMIWFFHFIIDVMLSKAKSDVEEEIEKRFPTINHSEKLGNKLWIRVDKNEE